MPPVAAVVGETLARLGVDTAFGVVGSGNFVAVDGLIAGGATFHAARHEGGAVCMADGWARVTGRVGVCTVHQGPGLTNAMTGLTEAAKASTPLLVLAADTPPRARLSNFRVDQHSLAHAVGAATERVHSPASAAADTARALRRAVTERRPVVLMLPIDLAAADAPAQEPPAAPTASVPPPPDPDAVERVADLLARARRPVLIGGRGAVLAGAGEAIEALGARTGALLATSAMAHGLFAGRPFALGIAGGFAAPHAADLLARADVVVAFGAGLNHWTTRHGALIAEGAAVVQVDLRPGAIGAHRPVAAGLVGDAAATARALEATLAARGHAAPGWRSSERAAEIARRTWHAEPYADATRDGRIDPRTLSIALDELLPEQRTVAVDSGHLTGWPAMYLGVPDARSWLFANAFQAVGLGLGTAIGAAVARPERVTVAAVGDGGLFMALEELETAARLRLRLLVVAYDDEAYGAEVHHFGPMGHDTATVRFPPADLAALARAAGTQALTARAVADLAPVGAWARSDAGPLVVDAKVNPEVVADWLQEAFRGG